MQPIFEDERWKDTQQTSVLNVISLKGTSYFDQMIVIGISVWILLGWIYDFVLDLPVHFLIQTKTHIHIKISILCKNSF